MIKHLGIPEPVVSRQALQDMGVEGNPTSLHDTRNLPPALRSNNIYGLPYGERPPSVRYVVVPRINLDKFFSGDREQGKSVSMAFTVRNPHPNSVYPYETRTIAISRTGEIANTVIAGRPGDYLATGSFNACSGDRLGVIQPGATISEIYYGNVFVKLGLEGWEVVDVGIFEAPPHEAIRAIKFMRNPDQFNNLDRENMAPGN